MKRIPKLIAVLVLTLLVLCSGIGAAQEPDGAVVAQTVTYEDVSVDVFRYTPDDFCFRGNNTPLLYVLGDGQFTEESANLALNTKGFKDIADKESCSILFVSPLNGESWTEQDYAAMQTLAGNAADDYFIYADYAGGVDKNGVFYASRFRHYTFAEGKAVEFAKEYLDTENAGYPIPQWTGWVDGFGAGFVYEEDGFTTEGVAAGWEQVRHTTRLYNNSDVTFLAPYYYWEEENISETVETIELDYADIPSLEYFLYVPEQVDLTSTTEKYPLVLTFHGYAYHPQALTQNTRLPMVAKENNFLVVAVNGLYSTQSNADAIADLIDYMIAHYPVDASRVYSTGYSKGTMETMNFAQAYTQKLAGVGLFEPVYGLFPVFEPTATLPMYAILGQDEFYPVFPRDTENASAALDAIGKVNGFDYAYDKEIGGLWGYSFDLNEAVRLPNERSVMHVHSIISKTDGVVYTKLVDAYQLGHNILPSSAYEIWDFLSQFSRNEDGTLTVNESNPYKDVAKGMWYYYEVQASAKANLFRGTSADEFSPDEITTRAMLVTALYRMAGEPETTGTHPFDDVTAGAWYEDAVTWASVHGVVNGTAQKQFSPDEALTREQAAAIFYRYAKLLGMDVTSDGGLDAFPDGGTVSRYATDAVQWAVASGIIIGTYEGGSLMLAPRETAVRAQSATLLLRFADVIAELGIQ